MNGYELISPINGKPCGIFVCGVCHRITHKDLIDRCCRPCQCGKTVRNRFEDKCSDCWTVLRHVQERERLEKAELVEWDGESMIFSDEVGYNDGWFESPDDLLDYLADEEEENKPEFAFVGLKRVNVLDIGRAIEAMTEDTYEDAELNVSDEDWAELQAAVDKFNAKYSVTYYEPDFSKKVRISDRVVG